MRWEFQADGRAVLPSSYIVLDEETSGLDADSELLSIEACRVCGGNIEEHFSAVFRPKRTVRSWVLPLIGLTEDALSQGGDQDMVLHDFFGWADDHPFIVWKLDFLLRFLPLSAERCYEMMELIAGTPYAQGRRNPKLSAIWEQCMGEPLDRKQSTSVDTLSIPLPVLADCRRQF